MDKTEALEYLQDYYNDNYTAEEGTFDEIMAQLADQLDMVSEDMAEAYTTCYA